MLFTERFGFLAKRFLAAGENIIPPVSETVDMLLAIEWHKFLDNTLTETPAIISSFDNSL
jgi:hypothetical protein